MKNPERPISVSQIVARYRANNPGISVKGLMEKTGYSKSTIYRALDELDIKAITPNPPLDLGDVTKGLRFYALPKSLQKGELPTFEYQFVHLAYALSGLQDNEYLPGWSLTKLEVLNALRDITLNDPIKVNQLVAGLLDLLAKFALIQGDLSAFQNMKGTNQIISQSELDTI